MVAVTHLGAFTERLAGKLAALRPLVVATDFDSTGTAATLRSLSASLTAFAGLGETLSECEPVADLAERVESLRSTAEKALASSLAAPITDARTHRATAMSLLGLLPEVLALSEAGKSVADTLGIQVALATVPEGADKPVGSLTPLPAPTPRQTPRPTPRPTPAPTPPKVATIAASFFGTGAKVTTYRVNGATPYDISRSIAAHGPYSPWLGERAAGMTKTRTDYRFVFSMDWAGSCSIEEQARPAIRLTYTIVLPRWIPPSDRSPTTVRWWNKELTSIATHEKVHVSIFRAAAKRANSILASSTCANATRRLNSIWNAAERDNCEFDMKEYGAAAGLSMKSCLVH